jgi:hypothetical protein
VKISPRRKPTLPTEQRLTIRLEIAGIEQLVSVIKGQNHKLDKIMATLEERFNAISSKLDEASAEILAQIEILKGESLSTEGEAALEVLEGKANALAEIAPPIEGTPKA